MSARPAFKPIGERAYPVYKYRELLQSIGTDADIQALIRSYGYDSPTVPVIKGWRMRNSIPTRWLPLLMHRAIQSGDLTDVTRLVKSPF